MWISILIDHRDCLANPFQPVVSRQADPFIFNIRKIQSQLSQRCSFHPSQVVFVFATLPPFVPSRTQISSSGTHFILVKSLHSFPSMFLSGDSQEDSNGASSSSLFTRSLLWWIQIKLSVFDHILFLISNVSPCRCTT